MAAGDAERRLWALIGLCCVVVVAQAADLRVHVMDATGASVADAVVSLHPVGGSPALSTKATAVMDQRGLRFVPFVLPVQVGTSVLFPNSDNVRHHVYSFSPAKRFELRLYAGNHASTVATPSWPSRPKGGKSLFTHPSGQLRRRLIPALKTGLPESCRSRTAATGRKLPFPTPDNFP